MLDHNNDSLDDKQKEIQNMQVWFIGANYLIILLLLLSNCYLILYLKRKERIMVERLGKDSGVF